jgi:methionine biosynthesis protein MetW
MATRSDTPGDEPRKRTMKHYTTTGAVDIAAADPNSSYAQAYALIPAGSRVLDLGCGSGELASYLAARGDRVWGVDVNAAAVAQAAPFCVDTRVVDLEETELTGLFAGLQFDVVLFADVLEHLREPWKALQAARDVLAPDGRVVASIPNFGHAAVRLAVVSGALPYRGLGILDDTHVRFFTLSGVESLFEESGFRLQAIARTSLPFGARSDLVPDVALMRVPGEIERLVRADPEHETLQFVVRAVMRPGAWDMGALRGRLHDVEAQLAEQTVGVRNLEREHDRARAGAAEHEARAVALEAVADELRAALAATAAERDAMLAERDAMLADLTARHDAALTAAVVERTAAVAEANERSAVLAAALADREAAEEQLTSAKAALAEALALRDGARAELADAQARLRGAHEEHAHRLEAARREGVMLQRALTAADARNRAADERQAAERARREALQRKLEEARDELQRQLEQAHDELERANAEHEQTRTQFDAQLQSARAEARERAQAVGDAEQRLARQAADAVELRAALSAVSSELAELRARDRRAGLAWLAAEHDMLAGLEDGSQFWRADPAMR